VSRSGAAAQRHGTPHAADDEAGRKDHEDVDNRVVLLLVDRVRELRDLRDSETENGGHQRNGATDEEKARSLECRRRSGSGRAVVRNR